MFLSLFRADAGDRSPWGDFWFEPVSIRSLAGQRVSADNAMRLSAVYASVRLLSRSFAILPFVLYRPKTGGGKEKVTDHWLYSLFAKRPNRFQNAFEWREMLQGHLELRGNAYNRIYGNPRGEVTELVPVHPDRIKPEILDGGEYRWRITNRRGTEEIVPRGEIWHIRGFSNDGLLGLNPIEMAREVLGLGLSAQEYAARFFANDARPTAGWIKMLGKFKDAAAREVFRESWQRAQAGENRGKVPVLEEGMEYKDPPAVSLKDLQFLELRNQSVADVARIFGIQPHLIGDLSRSTNNNIEQQSLEFVLYTVTPLAERWEASIEAEFISDDEDLEVEFDFKKLLRADMAGRSTYYHNMLADGVLTRNEVRDEEGLDPLVGLDKPLAPLNMGEGGKPQPAKTPNTPPPADDPSEDDSTDARLAALADAAAERVARKELLMVKQALAAKTDPHSALADAYGKHALFLQKALNVSVAAALEHCEAQRAWLLADSKEIEESDFLATTHFKLMRLALKGKP
jgi:HK97 family phage portal protein